MRVSQNCGLATKRVTGSSLGAAYALPITTDTSTSSSGRQVRRAIDATSAHTPKAAIDIGTTCRPPL